MDEPTDLPDGTELELTAADLGDDLAESERAALHEALAEAWESVRSGDLVPAADLLRELCEKE